MKHTTETPSNFTHVALDHLHSDTKSCCKTCISKQFHKATNAVNAVKDFQTEIIKSELSGLLSYFQFSGRFDLYNL